MTAEDAVADAMRDKTGSGQPGNLLELRGIRKRFGATVAIDGIDLTVAEGEFVTLLGPSGCGKTTTLRLIGGFHRPDAGEIRVSGKVISSPDYVVPPAKRSMGMVFQSFAVWPHMSVIENISLPLRVRKVAGDDLAQRCQEVLRLCRIEAYARRFPHELSGGQLQRVALARTLVYKPTLVLLDEPLSNLDVALREELRNEIKALHRKVGLTFILVTHDQEEALSLSDRVVVMNQGRIEQIGTSEDIYKNPRSLFVSQFVSGANKLPGRVVASPYAPDSRYAMVKVGGEDLVCAVNSGARAGDECTLIVQPEEIRCVAFSVTAVDGLGEANRIVGRIEDLNFRGRTQEIFVSALNTSLKVVRMGGEELARNQQVVLAVDPSALRFM